MMRMIDKTYCMSSFLMYRTVYDKEKSFGENYPPIRHYDIPKNRTSITNGEELYCALKSKIEEATKGGKAALALSGGIDSAILAKFMPKGSIAYTFKCVVPGMSVTDETEVAAQYAKECGLEHRIVEIYWEDFEKYAPILMAHKGAPIHSIEVQIYKAGLQAKKDNFDTIIYGEAADLVFGGLSRILSRDWLIGELLEWYSYVMPYKVLKQFEIVDEPFRNIENMGFVDGYEFCTSGFMKEALNSYYNACDTAGIKFYAPYSLCQLGMPIDYNRIRNGENKYLVREVFNRLYKGFTVPEKLPMPRATNEWLKDWKGPSRPEFYPHCTDNMTGDQKWLVWALETFLNMYEPQKDDQ